MVDRQNIEALFRVPDWAWGRAGHSRMERHQKNSNGM